MNTWPDPNNNLVHRYLQTLSLRRVDSQQCVLSNFQRFASERPAGERFGLENIEAWLRERANHWKIRTLVGAMQSLDRFLDWLVANHVLPALRSFFSFVADREPLAAAQCAAVLRTPIKRGPHRDRCYLESTELQAILAAPDRETLEGQRDHALLALLYNTGARIQEALDLCPKAVRLESPGQVRLMGKGRKERLCPIWPETAELLAALLQRQPRGPDEPIFINRYGRPLGASGFRFQLRQYVQMAAEKVPALSDKRISPHTLRHSAAVHLVAAGVDLTVIRSWMGHAHLDTTNLYAQANLEPSAGRSSGSVQEQDRRSLRHGNRTMMP